jgi:peptidyl-tRNA hydrolase
LPPWAAADPEKIPDFVLSRFEAGEKEIVENTISLAVEALGVILEGGLDLAISRYNKINPTPES